MCTTMIMQQEFVHGNRMVRCDSGSGLPKEPIIMGCNKKRAAAAIVPIKAFKRSKRPAKHSKPTRSVRFAADNETKLFPLVQEQDRTNVWYQNHEFYRIRNEILASLQAFSGLFKGTDTGVAVDVSQHCLRGLETAVSADLNKARQQRIHTTKQVVFYQQTLHKMNGISDPDAIGVLATRAAKEAHDAAASAGLLDLKALSE